jgi:hypothetical protein
MKICQILCLLCASTLLLPVLSHAAMYKWKDKNGVTQYTDTPPPYRTPQLPFGNKKLAGPTTKPTGREPLSRVVDESQAPVKATGNVPTAKATADAKSKADASAEDAAKKRQQVAEIEKIMKQEKEAQAKAKQDSCKAAKANFETYNQGGKIFKITENGGREYMNDNDIQTSKNNASKEISQYCN